MSKGRKRWIRYFWFVTLAAAVTGACFYFVISWNRPSTKGAATFHEKIVAACGGSAADCWAPVYLPGGDRIAVFEVLPGGRPDEFIVWFDTAGSRNDVLICRLNVPASAVRRIVFITATPQSVRAIGIWVLRGPGRGMQQVFLRR